MPKMPLNPPTMTKQVATRKAFALGLTGTHKMPDGKYHPGSTHEEMVNAIKAKNSKFSGK